MTDPACRRLRARVAALAAVALLAAACAGSGKPTDPSGPEPSLVEEQLLGLLNNARRGAGVAPDLRPDPALGEVARAHSDAMRDQGFLAHTSPAGGLRARLAAAGILFAAAGENVAQVAHPADPAGVALAQLMSSPDHRANILRSEFEIVGVGVARDGDRYWITQIFVQP